MNIIKLLTANKKTMIVVAIAVLIMLLGLVLLLQNTTKQELPANSFSREEENYSIAPPQDYVSTSTGMGLLVVTSAPEGARVVIDPPEEEASESSKNSITNTTPFRVNSIPTGEHLLTAFVKDYELYTETFTVEEGKVTRLNIKMKKILSLADFTPGTVGYRNFWISKLPLENQYYRVEHIKESDSLKVTITPPPAVQTTKEAQVEFLQNKVETDLQNLGAEIEKEKIEWIIQ